MGRTLDYIDKLKELDTSGVEPMSHIFPVENVFRDDIVENGDDRERMLANAPEQKRRAVSGAQDSRLMQEEQIHGNIEYDSCRAWQKKKQKEISVAEAVTVSGACACCRGGNPLLCDSRRKRRQ